MNTTTTTDLVTLRDFLNDCPRDQWPVIFAVGIGCPGGEHLLAGDPDYQLPDSLDRGDIQGTVEADGTWHWDGSGDPRDWKSNSYLKLEAWYTTHAKALALAHVE